MKPRFLSKVEWFTVRTMRGCAMTGYFAHRAKAVPIDPNNPSFVRGVGKTYYWSMGLQPTDAIKILIARKCPVAAAAAFLEFFEPRNPAAVRGSMEQPVKKATAA